MRVIAQEHHLVGQTLWLKLIDLTGSRHQNKALLISMCSITQCMVLFPFSVIKKALCCILHAILHVCTIQQPSYLGYKHQYQDHGGSQEEP